MADDATSADDLDFDLAHYSLSELRAFFGLDPAKEHTAAEIDARAHQIRETLVASGRIRKGAMRAFVVFVASAASKLIDSAHPPAATQPSQAATAVIPSLPYIAPNEFYVKTTARLLAVDTRHRTGGSYAGMASNFTLTLPNRLSQVVEMDLVSLEMPPDAVHNISRALRNSHFLMRVVFLAPPDRCADPAAGTPCEIREYMVTVPDGRYDSVFPLVDALNDAICAATPLHATTTPERNELSLIRAQYCTRTNRITIGPVPAPPEYKDSDYDDSDNEDSDSHTCAADPDRPFLVELDFSTSESGDPDETHEAAYYTRLGRVLGFVRRKYSGANEPDARPPGDGGWRGAGIRAEAPVDLSLCVRYFFLEIDDFQGQYAAAFVPATIGAASANSILAKVVLNGAVGAAGEKGSQVLSAPRVYLGPAEISRLQVRLTDPRGRPIELAGDFSFTLRFRLLYDSPLIKTGP